MIFVDRKCASNRYRSIGKRCVARSCRVRGRGAAFPLGSMIPQTCCRDCRGWGSLLFYTLLPGLGVRSMGRFRSLAWGEVISCRLRVCVYDIPSFLPGTWKFVFFLLQPSYDLVRRQYGGPAHLFFVQESIRCDVQCRNRISPAVREQVSLDITCSALQHSFCHVGCSCRHLTFHPAGTAWTLRKGR